MVCPSGLEENLQGQEYGISALLCKEQNSTCQQMVQDATTIDIHHDDQVPNT